MSTPEDNAMVVSGKVYNNAIVYGNDDHHITVKTRNYSMLTRIMLKICFVCIDILFPICIINPTFTEKGSTNESNSN